MLWFCLLNWHLLCDSRYIYQVLAKLPVIRVTFAAIMKSVPEVLEITIIVLFFMVTFSIVFIAEYVTIVDAITPLFSGFDAQYIGRR